MGTAGHIVFRSIHFQARDFLARFRLPLHLGRSHALHTAGIHGVVRSVVNGISERIGREIFCLIHCHGIAQIINRLADVCCGRNFSILIKLHDQRLETSSLLGQQGHPFCRLAQIQRVVGTQITHIVFGCRLV